MQVKFALFSIYEIRYNANSYLASQDKEGKVMYKEKCFYYIQNLLSSYGNISKVLFNKSDRCKELINFLRINVSDYTLLANRAIRDSSEHFDERLDKFDKIIEENGGSYADCHIGSRHDVPMMKDVDIFLRRYSPVDNTIFFTDKSITKELSLNIDELEKELNLLSVYLVVSPLY